METDDLVSTLREAGLSPYQADAYVSLLELGTATASQVADASGVPQPRVYDVLRTLEERDYVETYEESALKARAHSPAGVLRDLRSRADRFEAAADEVEQRWEQPDLESNRASVVSRFQTVIERAESFIDCAQHQIQLAVSVENFERLRPRLAAAHDRGVSTRVCVLTGPESEFSDRSAFEGICLEARNRTLPGPFVALVDREKTCFAYHPSSSDQYGVLVNDSTHTYVFHWYFLTCLWENWPTVYTNREEGYPVEYVDLRQFVRDVRPLLGGGGSVDVGIEGYDLDTGDRTTVDGQVVDTLYGGSPASDDTAERLAGQVAVVVDDGRATVTVGGWGAMLEEVEATRIEVRDVCGADGEAVPPNGWATVGD